MSRCIEIDPMSCVPLLLDVFVGQMQIGSATGFVVERDSKRYLVTNRHVVTAMDPSNNSATRLGIWHHDAHHLGTWHQIDEALTDELGRSRWLEHPQGAAIDVVALPLRAELPTIRCHPLDDIRFSESLNIRIHPAMVVHIVGFPLGLTAGGVFAIWKTGHIASEPCVNFGGLPMFLIDATTRGGMSGSPVFVRRPSRTGYGDVMIFLGVYSGRLHKDSEIGQVWRPQVIREIFQFNAVPDDHLTTAA